MNVDFLLPELGENVTSGDVVNVLVHEGDAIVGNQGVIEIETEKAVVEVPCPHPGKVAKIHVTKGQTIKVGQPVLTIESEEEAEEPPPVAPVSKEEGRHAARGRSVQGAATGCVRSRRNTAGRAGSPPRCTRA